MRFEVNLEIIPQDLLCFHRFYRRTYEKRQVVFRLFLLIVIALCALCVLRLYFLYKSVEISGCYPIFWIISWYSHTCWHCLF